MEKKILKILNRLALKAAKNKEMPIAAVLVCENKIIAKAYNRRNKSNYTTSHAEIIAIHKANKKLKSWRLNNCSLYVTIKPCEMCDKVIKEARLKEVYYLLDRPSEKKQHNKTDFYKLNDKCFEDDIKKYTLIIDDFWKIRRK